VEQKDGFSYSFDSSKCSECGGTCCIGESGNIWLTNKEIEDISLSLKINTTKFTNLYTDKIKYKTGLKEIKIGEQNYRCIFFDMDTKRCVIYEHRPKQCRTFPFWDYFKSNYKELENECIGVKNLAT
jgi:Fe-S-cluster containining protein